MPPAEPAGPLALDDRPNLVEQELVARVRAGDETAFARLYETHWEGVHRLLARLLGDVEHAGDLAQEVFVQFYRRPPADLTATLRAWLYRVAVNRGYNALRSDRRRRVREDAAAREHSPDDASGSDLAAAANLAEERDMVRRTLLRLPERQRDCLTLKAEGLSYAEIAGALGVAPGSVGTLLVRAERAFKDAYLAQRGGM